MTRAGGVNITLRQQFGAGLVTLREGRSRNGGPVPVQMALRGRRCSSGAGTGYTQAGDKAVDNWGEIRGAVDNASGATSSH
jgi:hypothetical protein